MGLATKEGPWQQGHQGEAPPQILLEAREGGIPGTGLLEGARVKKSRAPGA